MQAGVCVPGHTRTLGETYMCDVLAHALGHVSFVFEGIVMGGFVRDGISGKEWNRIDIVFPHTYAIHHFKLQLAGQLGRILGAPRCGFRLERTAIVESFPMEHREGEIPRFMVHRHRLTWLRAPLAGGAAVVAVGVDLTVTGQLQKLCLRVPPTVGSALRWTAHGIRLRAWMEETYDVHEIKDMLRRARDVACLPAHAEWARMDGRAREPTQAYYREKHAALRARGYTHVGTYGIQLAEFIDSVTIDLTG